MLRQQPLEARQKQLVSAILSVLVLRHKINPAYDNCRVTQVSRSRIFVPTYTCRCGSSSRGACWNSDCCDCASSAGAGSASWLLRTVCPKFPSNAWNRVIFSVFGLSGDPARVNHVKPFEGLTRNENVERYWWQAVPETYFLPRYYKVNTRRVR